MSRPQPLAAAVLGGLISSGLFLSPLSGLPGMLFLAYFVQLPLLLAGLSLGVAGSLIAAASAILVNAVMAGIVAGLVFALVQALPVVFVVRQSLLNRRNEQGDIEWFPPGLVLAQVTVGAAAAVVVAAVAFLGEPGGLAGAVERLLGEVFRGLGAIPEGDPLPESMANYLFLVPGLVAGMWVVMLAVNAVMAQALSARAKWNRRPTPAMADLEVPRWLWLGIAIPAVLAVLGGASLGFLGQSLLIVFAVPYVFLGLAVLHTVARTWSHPGFALAIVYGLIVILGWPVVLILALGLIEDVAHLRQRLLHAGP